MTDSAVCPFCSNDLEEAFLYLRGLSCSLHVSDRADVGLFSRAGLNLIDMRDISLTNPSGQAVIKALHCRSCDSVSFRASKTSS